MSMLSMQIDKLRRHADLYDGTTKPELAKELQRPYLAQELRDAADTIWQLRDDLQRTNDAVRDAEHDESCAWDRVRKAEAENARLRELLGDALKTLFYKRFDGSVGCTENCPRWQFGKDCQLVDGCWLELEAAKLGIEVEL